MRISGSKLRRPIGVLTVSLIAGGVLASPASAAEQAVSAATLSATLTARLGDRAAGSYVDDSGKLIVAVTDADTAASVRAAGATPKYVAHSGAALAAADNALKADLTVPGTAFAVEPMSNQVVVTADSTVTGARLDAVRAIVAKLGDTARLESVPGTLSTTISGGDAITTGGSRCSLGFNVRSGSTYYFLTAGHCTNAGASWSAGGAVLGSRFGTSFPGNDYGIVRYTNTGVAKPSAVGSVRITAAATPAVNTTVTRRGSTTGTHSGRVTALNATVNYGSGQTVSGLIRTTVCAEPGDSGGPLYSGNTAHGLTSGGSGNCSSGGVTFFQPVVEALNQYGVSVF